MLTNFTNKRILIQSILRRRNLSRHKKNYPPYLLNLPIKKSRTKYLILVRVSRVAPPSSSVFFIINPKTIKPTSYTFHKKCDVEDGVISHGRKFPIKTNNPKTKSAPIRPIRPNLPPFFIVLKLQKHPSPHIYITASCGVFTQLQIKI